MSEFFDVIPKETFAPQTEMKVQDRKQQEFRLPGSEFRQQIHNLVAADFFVLGDVDQVNRLDLTETIGKGKRFCV